MSQAQAHRGSGWRRGANSKYQDSLHSQTENYKKTNKKLQVQWWTFQIVPFSIMLRLQSLNSRFTYFCVLLLFTASRLMWRCFQHLMGLMLADESAAWCFAKQTTAKDNYKHNGASLGSMELNKHLQASDITCILWEGVGTGMKINRNVNIVSGMSKCRIKMDKFVVTS